MLLVLGWRSHAEKGTISLHNVDAEIGILPMNGAADVSASEERERVASIHSQRGVQRLDILPFSGLVVLDLQSSDRLAEKKRPGTEICG